MVVALCHLGDSPMHAEVSNTMNPAGTLTPCRMCHLRVDTIAQKRTQQYVGDFVGVHSNGDQVCELHTKQVSVADMYLSSGFSS